jgi:hypothetical protein
VRANQIVKNVGILNRAWKVQLSRRLLYITNLATYTKNKYMLQSVNLLQLWKVHQFPGVFVNQSSDAASGADPKEQEEKDALAQGIQK